MSINNDKNAGKVERILAESIVHSPLTPRRINSRFSTIQEWLHNICDGKKPGKPSETFTMDFITSSIHGYLLRIYGVNNYRNCTHGYDTLIEYLPKSADMYFKPIKSDDENLDYQQYKEKITLQIKLALTTEKVRTSFLAEANHICLSFTGEKIILK